jgi:signal transduction histidine kinase
VELDLLGQQPAESAGQLGGQLRDLSAQVKQLSSSVHALSHQLHPAKLEQLGLVTSVRGLCKELTQSHGTPIDFSHARIPAAIPEDVVLCLYRIVQECLGNVIKHSGARQAKVEMSGTADAICLRIADDGAGFDLALASRDGGLGLVSIRERLRLVQGELAIESRSSDGTRINVRIPLISSGTPGDDLEVAEVRIG